MNTRVQFLVARMQFSNEADDSYMFFYILKVTQSAWTRYARRKKVHLFFSLKSWVYPMFICQPRAQPYLQLKYHVSKCISCWQNLTSKFKCYVRKLGDIKNVFLLSCKIWKSGLISFLHEYCSHTKHIIVHSFFTSTSLHTRVFQNKISHFLKYRTYYFSINHTFQKLLLWCYNKRVNF